MFPVCEFYLFFALQHLVNLFARLANDNIGYIDWDPYIPKVSGAFTHLRANLCCHPQPCLFGCLWHHVLITG